MRRGMLFAISLLGLASTARAQYPVRIQHVQPKNWSQLSVGLLSLASVHDGSTNSTWDFGDGSTIYRATLEQTLQAGSALGVAVSYAPVTLRYTSSNPLTPDACADCDATAKIYQALAFFHNGAGPGFHSVIELTLGATIYSNFRETSSGARLGRGSDSDLSFSFAYGFGYGLASNTDIELIQEIGDGMHQKTNQPANASRLNRIGVTRLAIRWGLGQ